MPGCCESGARASEVLAGRQRRTLGIVLAINAAMFAVEAAAGLIAGSVALLADSLDMLGDALVYGLSLYVVARGARWKAGSAMVKGLVQLAFGLSVLGVALYKALHPAPPAAEVIGGIGLLALAANTACAWLLLRHRHEDVNMHSVWLCSRNDLVSNLAVILAGGLVAASGSHWPDVVVGLAIAALFLKTAAGVVGRSAAAWRQAGAS
ncbi:MAG TPA: cation transporter [Burkholderiales bacterium]|nr:cation transporter [Burkholderiales bacterium]